MHYRNQNHKKGHCDCLLPNFEMRLDCINNAMTLIGNIIMIPVTGIENVFKCNLTSMVKPF